MNMRFRGNVGNRSETVSALVSASVRFHLGEMLEIPIIVQERNALVDGRRSDRAVVRAAWRYTLRRGVTGFARTIV